MTTTSMPGFTAEISLYRTGKHYMAGAGVFDHQTARAYLQPAMRDTCEVLSGLLRDAYAQGSYTEAQFFYEVMEVAGCFRSLI
jgi:hypothetical protein